MRIEHIAIWASDIELLRAFYIKYFDCKANDKYINKKKAFESYFLEFESGCRLELMKMSNIPENKNDLLAQYLGIIHFAISVGSKAIVDSITERFKNDGYKIVSGPRVTGDGYYESCILDPEGNRIEITI